MRNMQGKVELIRLGGPLDAPWLSGKKARYPAAKQNAFTSLFNIYYNAAFKLRFYFKSFPPSSKWSTMTKKKRKKREKKHRQTWLYNC